MLCEECRERQATVHLTKIINNRKTETHLCERCAREKGELQLMIEPKFTIHNLLAGLLDGDTDLEASPKVTHRSLQCPNCGISYREFSRTGRLGCARCYETFDQHLVPLLRRIHGSAAHTGKVPERTGGVVRVRKQISRLREELQQAVSREEFERAAQLRDKIRELETGTE